MRRRRLLWQLYPSYLLITLVPLIAAFTYSLGTLRGFYYDEVAASLESSVRLLERGFGREFLHSDPARIDEFCKSLGREISARVTFVSPSGVVLGDTHSDPAEMDNHAGRPEVQDALATGLGRTQRHSDTLEQNLMYLAVQLKEDGDVRGILRLAVPVTSIDETLSSVGYRNVLAGAGIALIAAALSWILSRRFSRPLEEMKNGAERFARGELDYRLPVPDSEETAQLAEAMNDMAVQLSDRIRSLAEQHNKQEALLSSMVEGVIAVDPRGHIITLNRSAAKLFNLDPERCQGKPLEDVILNPTLRKFLTRTLKDSGVTEGEVVVRAGQERVLRTHGATLRDGQGEEIGALVVMNDITRLRRLEAMRRDFVANVSHELKTPVTSIKGFVETLHDGALSDPEAARRFLEIIAKQADRLQTIIEDLLSLSRIERDSKTEQIEFTRCALEPVLQAAIQDCEPKARECRTTVELHCEEDPVARINPRLLEQALVNLIDNALKYSDPESRVRVDAYKENGRVVIRVTDEGCGVAAKHLPRLFERFYRVDKARSRHLGGTGLGLAIVKHIVQAHGGKVDVESTLDEGTTFTIRLLES